jgi:hypothetical protein
MKSYALLLAIAFVTIVFVVKTLYPIVSSSVALIRSTL